jgi:1-acyl-sn-glycerol-3-phosphate acyltransferase
MRCPPRAVRRILLPVDVALVLVLGAAFLVVALLGLVVGCFGGRRRLLRVGAAGVAYCAMEIVVLSRAAGLWLRLKAWRVGRPVSEEQWVAVHEALLDSTLAWLLHVGRRCFGFTVVLDQAPEPAALHEPLPVLVLARHGGPGDSFALVHLLLNRYHRRVRIVLKDLLQLDPVFDIVLNRIGNCFLPATHANDKDLTAQLAGIARVLGPGDALLLFPEGRNWTPDRRLRAIRRLRADHGPRAARTATLMAHVLPPRPGGVLACLDARPDLAVVVVAHAGLDRIVRVRQGWDQLPFTTPMTIRVWPTAPVPQGDDAKRAWLTTEWAVVDQWIDAHHDGAATPSTASPII